MQIKVTPAPVEASVSPFGWAGFFVADSAEVASGTHGRDFIADGVPEVGTLASAWVAVPFGRDLLVAAGMWGSADGYDLAAISDDEIREWVLGVLLYHGTGKIGSEVESEQFRNGYRDTPQDAELFALIGRRIDGAFGFTGWREPGCSCEICDPGTPDEYRVLNRACPVHRDPVPASFAAATLTELSHSVAAE